MNEKLQSSEQALEQLRQEVAKSPELRWRSVLEGDQHTQMLTDLWDITRSHYEVHQSLAPLMRQFDGQFSEVEDMQKRYQTREIAPPESKKQDEMYKEWSLYQERIHDKYDDMESTSDKCARAIYDPSVLIVQDRCRKALEKAQGALDKIDAMEKTNENVAVKEEIGKMQKALQEATELLSEKRQIGRTKWKQIHEQCQTFKQKEVAEVDQRVRELESELSSDTTYFPSYKRSAYNSEAEGRLSVRYPSIGACGVSVAGMRMSDYPKSAQFDVEKITPKQVADAVKFVPGVGTRMDDIVAGFQDLGMPELHSVVNLNARRGDPFASLEKLLQYQPAIVSLAKEGKPGHDVVVDKIERDAEAGFKYVYIRDANGGAGYEGRSYRVGAHAFRADWDRYVIVPTKSLSLL